MAIDRDPDLEWLDHVQPVGLVVAPSVVKELGLTPERQTAADNGLIQALISDDTSAPALVDPWPFFDEVLGWPPALVAGAPGGPPLAETLTVSIAEHEGALAPTWAVLAGSGVPQLLVRIEAAGVDPDKRHALKGWEATPQQRFERLLHETGVFAGLLITERARTIAGDTVYSPELRLVYAPASETSGYIPFPLRPMRDVAGRPMLAGLKLMLGAFTLFSADPKRRLSAILRASREAQAAVSEKLAGQVLGALHELLRGLDAADPALIRDLAGEDPGELYDGLLAVLMRLVFTLYAEDRDLLPSLAEAGTLYERNYSVRGLYADLTEDAALNPDTMDERRGGWGRLIALFRLIHAGHPSGFIGARGGALFDPKAHLFLEGRRSQADPARILPVSDGCVLRVLEGLMTLKAKGQARERLSYRTLDVEQIGSVYETVMGFAASLAKGPSLAVTGAKKLPVFLDLDALAARKGKDRIKAFHETAGAALKDKRAAALEAAGSEAELIAALAPVIDARGSPSHAPTPAGRPILQPTQERRLTGSQYTPRSLTAPIVEHALAPAFERVGEGAAAEQILALKVCDPAMGSGAFLVEACRQIAGRLVKAWARHESRPSIPHGETEALLALRLVAQHCLYGVDRNPRAVELELSLWLATLAQEHEFTFLDHALKCGDSLVGLDRDQIAATHWDASQAPTFVGQQVDAHLREAEAAREEIRSKAEWASEADLRVMLRAAEGKIEVGRLVGDGVIAAFFSAAKPKKRIERLVAFQNRLLAGSGWEAAAVALRRELAEGEPPLPPFHWQLEFPEVFSRDNPGFDAIVGNPPFAGKNTIIAGNHANYLPWLQTLHPGAHGNSDLVAHFFRRAFGLLRQGGVFGLIATKTISQGDTRESGLTTILANGGSILRAAKRLKWPGDNVQVIVAVVHMMKGKATDPVLEGRPAKRISAFLVEGELDVTPQQLKANTGKSFQGSIVLGMGFTFDDQAAAKGKSENVATMLDLIERDPRNAERIFPYLGGEEVNTSPTHSAHRHVIDFANFPLCRNPELISWSEMTVDEKREALNSEIVPTDYPTHVAADWPDLLSIVERLVKAERGEQQDKIGRKIWWRFLRRRDRLYNAIASLERVLAIARVTQYCAFTFLPSRQVFHDKIIVSTFDSFAPFTILNSRAHELWAIYFSSTVGETLNYTPSDCFRTFPFPRAYQTSAALEGAGEAYHEARAALMVARNEGLTKTYNRFHDRTVTAPDIAALRDLHAAMDRAVLAAYGWHDLAEAAKPEFIDQDADEGKTPKTRLDWPPAFKDEVLTRLLRLNAQRPAAVSGAGRVFDDDDDDNDGENGEGE